MRRQLFQDLDEMPVSLDAAISTSVTKLCIWDEVIAPHAFTNFESIRRKPADWPKNAHITSYWCTKECLIGDEGTRSWTMLIHRERSYLVF